MPGRKETMKRFVVLALLAMSVLTMGLPSSTHAASQVYRFRGQIADASFLTADALDSCIVTDVWVRAFSEGSIQPANKQTAPAVAVQLTKYNRCEEAPSLISADGFAWLPADALQIDGRLNTASLRTTVDLYDWVSETTIPVAIDINWIGNGDTITGRERTHFHVRKSNFLKIDSFAEKIRISEASGTVMLRGENVTPEPAWDAKLATRTSSELIIYR
jgi:hypothetical protein